MDRKITAFAAVFVLLVMFTVLLTNTQAYSTETVQENEQAIEASTPSQSCGGPNGCNAGCGCGCGGNPSLCSCGG